MQNNKLTQALDNSIAASSMSHDTGSTKDSLHGEKVKRRTSYTSSQFHKQSQKWKSGASDRISDASSESSATLSTSKGHTTTSNTSTFRSQVSAAEVSMEPCKVNEIVDEMTETLAFLRAGLEQGDFCNEGERRSAEWDAWVLEGILKHKIDPKTIFILRQMYEEANKTPSSSLYSTMTNLNQSF